MPPQERDVRRHTGLITLAAAVLTAIIAGPALRHPTQQIFGVEMIGRHADPFTVIQQFAGAPIASGFVQPLTDWAGRALAQVLHPVAAYNLIVLLSFPLAAWWMYLLAFTLTESAIASSVAALAFAFAPFHLAQAAYHPHVAQVQWIPLALLAIWHATHRFSWRTGLGLAAALAAAVLANAYHALILSVAAPLAAVLFSMTPSREGQRGGVRDLAGTLAVMATGAVVAIAVIARVAPIVLTDAVAASRDDLFIYSARWWSYLVPGIDHPILGTYAGGVWHRYAVADGDLEQQVYVGWSLLAACGVAAWSWLRQCASPVVPALVTLAAVAGLCSLAPERAIWGLDIPKPSAWLYVWLPMFRSYARFAVIVQCALALVGGLGIATLWGSRRGRPAALALVALLCFEYAPWHTRARDVLPTSAHRWIAAHADRGATLDCAASSRAEANVSWLAGRVIDPLGALVADCGEPDLSAKLRALGYRALIARAANPLHVSDTAGMSREYDAPDGAVWRIDAAPAPFFLADLQGFSPREHNGEDSWRWMGASGAAAIFNRTGQTATISLHLELAAFAGPRHLTVTIDDTERATWLVTPTRAWFDLGPITLSEGRHTIRFASPEPALAPSAIGVSADERRLGLQLCRWAW